MKIALAALLYCILMVYEAAFGNFSILAFFCIFVVGPVLAITSIALLVIAIVRHKLRPAVASARLFCIAIVVFWSFEFLSVSRALIPHAFAMVAKENERLAVAFMREQPADTDVEVGGFRYPYYEIVPGGKLTTKHHAGVVSIWIPAGPSNDVYLVYVSPSSEMPYKAPTQDNMGQGWKVIPLAENWYYAVAVGI